MSSPRVNAISPKNALTCGDLSVSFLCGASDLHVRVLSRSKTVRAVVVTARIYRTVRFRAVPLTCTCGSVRCRAVGPGPLRAVGPRPLGRGPQTARTAAPHGQEQVQDQDRGVL